MTRRCAISSLQRLFPLPARRSHGKSRAMSAAPTTFEERLRTRAAATEAVLGELLAPPALENEILRPQRLLDAMRHGVLNGGKRLRPFLVMEAAALFDRDDQAAQHVAAAIECVHCYSLIHDDLPAMDDDALRRGKPTVHVAYDDATAILAGDSLLTMAFDIIASEPTIPAEHKVDLVSDLSRSAGLGGMAGGQMLDIAAETATPDEQGIITLQSMKTGALIRFSCEAGAIVAGCGKDDSQRLRRFGERIGLAFQLADDLLDIKADASAMGKATGKDAARGKGTLVALHGVDWAEAELARQISEAQALLEPFGLRGEMLCETARFIAARRS